MSLTKDISVEDLQELLKERLTINVRVYTEDMKLKTEVVVDLDGKFVRRDEFSKDLMESTND